MSEQQELIPMATGEYLKQRRLERKFSLDTVAQAIHLDAGVLRAIEEENADNIAQVYRKGYIQQYARYLKVPEEDIPALLAAGESGEPPIRNIFTAPPKRNIMDNWLRATSYVLASLLIGTLAWQFTHEAVRLSQSGSALQGSNDSEASAEVESSASQEVLGTVNASIAPLGALHGQDANSPDTAEQAWAAISGPALPEGESRLHLAVSADSWVEITDADGLELEMDLLRGGSEKDYQGKPPFKILLGRASAVRLSMDGEPVDLNDHTEEDVAQLTWPQKLRTASDGTDSN
jgi:cytoskeleton protein RodZ